MRDFYRIEEIIGLNRSCYIGLYNLAAVEVLVKSGAAQSGAATT